MTATCANSPKAPTCLSTTPSIFPSEYEARRRGWGHSHWREAVDIAQASGVKELVLYHHDPDHDDQCVDAIVKSAAELFPRVRAAREGAIIEL